MVKGSYLPFPLTNMRDINGWVERFPLTNMRDINGCLLYTSPSPRD